MPEGLDVRPLEDAHSLLEHGEGLLEVRVFLKSERRERRDREREEGGKLVIFNGVGRLVQTKWFNTP